MRPTKPRITKTFCKTCGAALQQRRNKSHHAYPVVWSGNGNPSWNIINPLEWFFTHVDYSGVLTCDHGLSRHVVNPAIKHTHTAFPVPLYLIVEHSKPTPQNGGDWATSGPSNLESSSIVAYLSHTHQACRTRRWLCGSLHGSRFFLASLAMEGLLFIVLLRLERYSLPTPLVAHTQTI